MKKQTSTFDSIPGEFNFDYEVESDEDDGEEFIEEDEAELVNMDDDDDEREITFGLQKGEKGGQEGSEEEDRPAEPRRSSQEG